jgi:hypothetical protein
VLGRERVERQDVVFGLVKQPRDLRQPRLELADRVGEAPAGLSAIGGGEQLADQGAQGVVLGLCGRGRGGRVGAAADQRHPRIRPERVANLLHTST